MVGLSLRRRRWALISIAGAAVVTAGAVAVGDVSWASARRGAVRGVGQRLLGLSASHWVTSWSASPQAGGSSAANGFDDQTVRNIVFTSVGGNAVRVRFTNAFGAQPLMIGAAAIGLAAGGASVAAATNVRLTFGGQHWVLVPPGAEALSDPVAVSVPALHDLAVSLYLPSPTGPATNHGDAQQINYVAPGDRAEASSGAGFTTQTQSWYFIDSIDVMATRPDLGTVVALGDSITDGARSTVNANARWPNDLARRLDTRPGETLSVADEGMSGNRVLNDSPCLGANMVARFDRERVDWAAAREVILLGGVNDIGFSELRPGPDDTTVGPEGSWPLPFSCYQPNTAVTASELISGYKQIIAQAHAAGLKVFGGTLTPFEGAVYWTPAAEAKREAVNQWILTSGAFDGLIDFAHAVADPSDPLRINPAYDSGDHLHPNRAGYQAMANAINLGMLIREA